MIQGMLAAMGAPIFFAYGMLVGEVLAPLMILLSLFTCPSTAIVAFNMLVAIAMHMLVLCFPLTKREDGALNSPYSISCRQ